MPDAQTINCCWIGMNFYTVFKVVLKMIFSRKTCKCYMYHCRLEIDRNVPDMAIPTRKSCQKSNGNAMNWLVPEKYARSGRFSLFSNMISLSGRPVGNRVRNHEKYLIVLSCTISCAAKIFFVHDRARIRARKKSCYKFKSCKNRAT